MSRTKYWKACNDALRQEMARDPSVIVLGEDVAGAPGRADDGFVDAWGGPFGITRGLILQFGPGRVRDTPISEAGFLGLAAGLAADGYRPWVDIMFTELMPVAWDQLTNRIARARYLSAGQLQMPITVKTFGECYSAVCHFPGLVCVAPSDSYTAKGLTTAAIRSDDPVVIFDSLKLLRSQAEVPDGDYAPGVRKGAGLARRHRHDAAGHRRDDCALPAGRRRARAGWHFGRGCSSICSRFPLGTCRP